MRSTCMGSKIGKRTPWIALLGIAGVVLYQPQALAQSCPGAGGLAAFGPLNEFGFPAFYTDVDGVRLDMCIDAADPLCPLDPVLAPLPFPGEPLDVAAGNFWGESFYWLAVATVPTSGGQGLLVMAIEAVFGGPIEEIIEGDQTVFSRRRIRVDGLSPGTYTITHPFGVDVFEVAAGGTRIVNDTQDCLHTVNELGVIIPSCGPGIGNFFTTPLDSEASVISTFLAWDPAESPPPIGYVGNPAILHTITGSPCDTNVFRIEAPDIGGVGIDMVETDLFSVAGKIFTICGDGIAEGLEQCDDGNIADGDCCSSTCQFEPLDTACDDGNLCTTGGVCDGLGTCESLFDDGVICDDDGDVCTIHVCASGVCEVGPTNEGGVCTDGDVCTLNICAAGVCVVDGFDVDAPCDDGKPCTADDVCAIDGTCAGIVTDGVPCDDGSVCTVNGVCIADVCEVLSINEGVACDDGDPCTSADVCDGAGTCVGVLTPPDFCVGKECGPDGCGGTCGTCMGFDICNVGTGLCEPCVPICDGLVCGDDTCGGTCGTCAAGESCQVGACVPNPPPAPPPPPPPSSGSGSGSSPPPSPPQDDKDGDGVPFPDDNCPSVANEEQEDVDNDGVGDLCDNCPEIANPSQNDSDEDGMGDGVGDACDNCPDTLNARDPDTGQQNDDDDDGIGDACDLCPSDPDSSNADTDGDGLGDVCDDCDLGPNVDADADGVFDACDLCPLDPDPSNADSDGDGVGDVCDNCPRKANKDQRDRDGDGLGDKCDNCRDEPNPGQRDSDGDGKGDLCDQEEEPEPEPKPEPKPEPEPEPKPEPESVSDPEVSGGTTGSSSTPNGMCGMFGMVSLCLTTLGLAGMKARMRPRRRRN